MPVCELYLNDMTIHRNNIWLIRSLMLIYHIVQNNTELDRLNLSVSVSKVSRRMEAACSFLLKVRICMYALKYGKIMINHMLNASVSSEAKLLDFL